MPTAGRRTAVTLLDILLRAAEEEPGQVVVHVRGDGSEHTVTFAELHDDALRVAGGLRAAGLEPGTPVPLLAELGEDFQPMFWGALAAGLVPVPLAPETRRVGPVWEFLGRPAVVVDDTTEALLAEIPGPVRALRLSALREGDPLCSLPRRDPQDLAFLQFSSGSTGAPKGVELTHEAVLANLRQIRAAMAITPDDVVATWMPYFHDMGLIGTHLVPMAARLKQVRLEPLTFAKRPARWLEAVTRHKATLLSAANFALALAVRRVPDSTWAGSDLSCVRLMLVGAEPIAPRVWREFTAKAGPAGLDATAMLPVYGLAEATLAVTVPPLGEIAEPLALDRTALSRGRAVPAEPGPDAVELMDVGRPVPDCEIRVTDDSGRSLGERRIGHIEVRGPQVARGYHRSPEASAAAFCGGWLRTGDVGFLDEGRLCVTGRHKDVVFVGGRTFHAPDIEETAAATEGLPGGTVAAIGSTDPDTGGDRVVVFVQWARPAPATALPVLDAAAARVREALGHDDVRVLPLPPGAFPRTTSGKLRRAVMRVRFEAGAYAAVEERLSAARVEGEPDRLEGERDRVGAKPILPKAESALSKAELPPAEGLRPQGPEPRSRRDVEDALRGIWARILDLAPADIDRDDRFFALGGSSLKAMAVLAGIEDAFAVTVEPRVLRDHDTVGALAGHVLAQLTSASTGCEVTSGASSRSDGGGVTDTTDAERASVPSGANAGNQPVAVLGMACRFPGASTPEAFWELLLAGRDTVTPAPDTRWESAPDGPGLFGSFLPDPADFDAAFFGLDDEEARATDPQARIFLELAHEALERAGYAGPRRTGRRIGVFAAVSDSGYREILAAATDGDLAAHPGALTGNLPNLIAARLCQALDLDGPALAVDTACSSALVALHLARRSLQSGECDVAVVGGVQLALTPTGHRLLARAGALSPTGSGRPFGAAADGIVPGEGGAVLVLSRLDDARRDGDAVLALVRGTAVNNDGRSLSLLAPNPRTQREVITQAYGECGVDPDAVSYVEAHGTGTPVGDPIEAQSLGHAFPPRSDGLPRLLGSVKANIGHLLNAAGMPGLLKTVLALQHRRIPPAPNTATPAPYLERVAPGFELVTEQREWRTPGPLVAGVNAFGFGGTNAHAVLEEAPGRTTSPVSAADGPHLLTLSAHSPDALRTAAADLAAYARTRPDLREADLCATVNAARDDRPHRLAVVVEGDLADRLHAARPADFALARSRPRTVFLMPGQGAQRPGQGLALYRSAPVFREVVDEASSLTGPVLGRSLAEWCLDPRTDPAELARTEVAQPLLVAFGVGLARQLGEWGLGADAVAGHSVGEIAAACVAGALSLAEAVGFAAERGRLVGELALPGAMVAVKGDENSVAELVAASGGSLSVAAVNGPGQVVISGSEDAVDRAVAELTGRGVATRGLRVSHAFHSPLLEPVLDPLRDAAKALTVKPVAVPMLSTVTGEWRPGLTPAYWQEHAVQPVRFGAAVARLLDEGYDHFVELGPGNTLGGAVRAVAGMRGGPDVAVLTTGLAGDSGRDPESSGARALLETAGRLWARGAELDRVALEGTVPAPLDRTGRGVGRPRVPVPTYPFQRTRHWPSKSGAETVVRRLDWRDAPLTSAAGPRVVRLIGADQVLGTAQVPGMGEGLGSVQSLGQALAERLTGRGVTVMWEGSTADETVSASPDTVVWLAGAVGTGDGRLPATAMDTAATTDTGLSAAVPALRPVLDLLATGCARLLVVTEDAYVVGASTQEARPAQALLHGFALALPQEYPGLAAAGIDLSARDPLDARVDALERELWSAPRPGAEDAEGAGGAFAWRSGRRLSRTPSDVPDAPAALDALPPDGTYLITGGAGGLGSALARDLAGRGARDLILTGRSETAPDELLSELRALGARARYRAADVSDAAAVDALFATLPPLDGVFHAAGTVRPGTLRAKSDGEIEQVLAAKVRGTVLLAEALRRHGQAPAVCVAFSSLSSVLPGLAGALGDYAAANAFLDAFAAAERAAGRPWQAIGFGPVADAGLAAGSPVRQRLRARGLTPMTARAAIAALRTAVATDAAHLLVTPSEPPAPAVTVDRPSGTQDSAVPAPRTPPDGEADAGAEVDPDRVADLVRRLLAEALHRAPEDIGDDEQFLGLGLDSLTAVDLARRLETELGLPLPATLLFEYRTIGELAAHLGGQTPTAAPALIPAPTAVTRRAAETTPRPLTPLQRAFLTTEALYEGVTAYGYIRQTVRGPLDPDLLGLALSHLAARHPMLRLRITTDATDATHATHGTPPPRQYAAPADRTDRSPYWYEVHEPDATTPPLPDLEQRLYNRPFDLTAEAPVRAALVRDRSDAHLAHLLLVVHHSAADGYSLKVLCEELWSLYTALADGRAPELPTPRAEFADYADLVTAERRSPDFTRDQRYWRDRIAEHTASATAPALPYDGNPEALPEPPLAHHQTTVDAPLTAALRELAARHEVSLFHLLLAVYGRCLARWSGQRAVAVNVARARREVPLPGIDRLVGPLADTLPVFADVDPDEPVTSLARRLQRIWREAESHATLGSPDIAALLPATGPAPRTVAPAGFSFARFPVSHGRDWPVTVTPTAAATASAATRLGLLCWESDTALRLSWNHPAHLFRRTTVERLAADYLGELRAATVQPPTPSLSPGKAATHPGDTTSRPGDTAAHPVTPAGSRSRGDDGVAARLSAQFRATPTAVAVNTGSATLTYAELDSASAALATRLRANGVRPGDLVGLLTEPGADTVVGVVGILRSGAGWVPLDAAHPVARLRDQVHRTGVSVVVCHTATRAATAALADITLVTADGPAPALDPVLPLPPADPDAIAYVIFTSGSTGRPKGVPITHRSMLNYLDWSLATFGYGPGDHLAQTANVCFDASVRQLLAPLLVGATIHTLTRDLVRDPEALLDRIVDDRITVWSSVPTLWERLLTAAETRAGQDGTPPDLSALRWVHVGGEALPAAHVRRWFDLLDTCGGPEHRVANLYGPTEATINATCHIIDTRPADDVRHLPIGRPVAGTELAVVTEAGRPCPPGEAGELLIAGTGLTPGYLGEPHLTAQAFVERDGHRWYRSGDRVRRTADGALEFLGRLDDQVKVRGHRVELGEVEAALLTHPDVSRAAVLLAEGRLLAYVEPRPGAGEPDARELRAFLARVLPPYMLPGRIRSMPAMPLTGTGKIDRKLLAREGEGTSGADAADGVVGRDGDDRAHGSAPSGPGTPPTTPTERTVARIWSALLDVPDVTRDDDFFALGGDSIMVLELFARLRNELPSVPRPTTLYTHRTLSAISAALDTAAATVPSVAPTPDSGSGSAQFAGPYPLTPSQRGFLLAETIDPGAGSGWLARFRLGGPLRQDVLQRAVDVLVARHPMLRTVFPAGARPPVQQELPDSLRLPVEAETLAHPDLLEERIAEEARRRLEPWAWPLLRLRLFGVAPDEHVLVVHAHHLIGDGYSAALLARELLTVYDRLDRGLSHGLPPLDSSFRDHVALSAVRPHPHGPEAEDYRARLGAPYTPPVLRNPTPEDADVQPAFHTTGFTLDPVTTGALRRLARAAHRTPYAPLLTAYYRALAAFTGQRDLVLGLAVTGREESTVDAHRVFGPFAEAVALRPAGPGGGDPGMGSDGQLPSFEDDLRCLAAEADLARAEGPGGELRTAAGLPHHAQFFFTFLDFTSLGSEAVGRLTLHADESDTALAPPPVGTDVFLAVRPVADGEGLRVTVRASAAALTSREVAGFAEEIRRQLRDALSEVRDPEAAPARSGGRRRRRHLDAALVGYLPAPHHLAAIAGLPPESPGLGREEIRALLFPEGRARLLEETGTPLGNSGFVALPLFADELAAGGDLAARTARAVEHAASLGARCVSLAGMIPSLTGYGYDVLRETTAGAALTTGHGSTTVAVVKTVRATLAATGRRLDDLSLAIVGCGSIGTSSLRLLLATAPRPPARLLLCDVPASTVRLKRLAADLTAGNPAMPVQVAESGRSLPASVYEADVIVTAVSGATNLLDIDRLRPGTTVVDDSFPHCFDTARALDRMSRDQDVLVVGGGLLALDATVTRLSDDLPGVASAGFAMRPGIAGTLASCRLESLLHAHLADSGRSPSALPLIHGLVDLPRALAHWDAAEAAGVRPAPLHLLDRVLAEGEGLPVRSPNANPAPDPAGWRCP
ncbi:amino acid adenylation domain-containing protein [Streptomyces cyaneochromogenes]|uniref:Amino acid adenylation domain-containing protein n=1 Tax=Streptomyces cyaneochromogenes TaxID=2496836 RepID=A0A3Q9F088_9ACTN|nr:non-ribosomal peptide synthetase/type I polyketide synthase [Streptomyces cyaneochromogenes]AZQ39733.1 amino acid adenylation domain-containing protein [Streptomyces cyaneochromogenes]